MSMAWRGRPPLRRARRHRGRRGERYPGRRDARDEAHSPGSTRRAPQSPVRSRARPADALDCPAGVTPMAGRHVFGNGRVLAIAAVAHMRGDPFALEENLDRLCRQPDVHLGAGEAIGHAVIMAGDLDVIIDADATD